ncbi:hypothetical protein CCACVL1_19948 [Corchorus capsularis]|uniref:Uncharacterized protein n=1 Tax=Corchorus capsularis TaxID=210143 RepID=A0A1R3HDS6_COCAP|nr:hypothetical protein CCACVL1_19948 [Corchorus capsularis]
MVKITPLAPKAVALFVAMLV